MSRISRKPEKQLFIVILSVTGLLMGCQQTTTTEIPKVYKVRTSRKEISTQKQTATSSKRARTRQAAPQTVRAFSISADSQVETGTSETSLTLNDLMGTKVVAQDGQFLGAVVGNEFDPNSLLNKFSAYRSEFDEKSIFYEFGKYGDEFSNLSAYNKDADKPPRIIDEQGKFIRWLTVNSIFTPRVDPRELFKWLKDFDINKSNRKN